jgi:hypothetical protein
MVIGKIQKFRSLKNIIIHFYHHLTRMKSLVPNGVVFSFVTKETKKKLKNSKKLEKKSKRKREDATSNLDLDY